MNAAGIDLTEACQRIGHAVLYLSGHTPAEQGYITSVNDKYVFVRFGASAHGVACHPDSLRWLKERDRA
jgi:hypothetical protein